MSHGTAPQPEFSRRIDLASLEAREVVREVEATPAEREALARRLDLIALHALKANLRVRQRSEHVVEVQGAFEADLEQACVVTLEPVPAHLEGKFQQIYSADAEEPSGEVVVDLDEDEEDDLPEPLPEDAIDLGEAVVQQLAVALDPYPRKPGAEIPAEYSGVADPGGQDRPFASLARLRRS
jgi:uncharacterized metal-binding protein YceD (DUF177 family)